MTIVTDEGTIVGVDNDGEPPASNIIKKTLQLRLYASNLPRRRRGLRSGIPSTYCAVTSLSEGPREQPTSGTRLNSLHQAALTGVENENYTNTVVRSNSGTGLMGQVWGKTEILQSLNPQWTKPIFLEYTEGSPLYFYVHVFEANNNEQQQQQQQQQEEESTNTTLADGMLSGSGASNRSLLDFEASLGSAAMEVCDILSTEHCTRAKRLRKGGCIFCRIEVAKISLDHMCHLQFAVALHKKSARSKNTEAYVELSKATSSKSSSSTWLIVHRSEVVAVIGTTATLTWDVLDLDLGTLCNGDLDKPIRIAVQRKGRGSPSALLVGVTETTLRHLLRMTDSRNVSDMDLPTDMLRPNELFLQQGLHQQRQHVGKLSVLQASLDRPAPEEELNTTRTVEQQPHDNPPYSSSTHQQMQATRVVDLGQIQPPPPTTAPVPETHPKYGANAPPLPPSKSFQDYIREGCVLDLCVAIDYTSSNGAPSQSHSLHYQSSAYNDYEEAILAICTAIDPYSSKEHSVWGFGAKFQDNVVRHLFQCGPTSKVIGTQGVLDAYRSVLQSEFVMSGPTILHPVIQAAARQAREHHTRMANTLPSPDLRYTVLLILTDGVANEFEETQRKLAVFSPMPLSVVIVGIGATTNFSKMHQLSQCPRGAYRPNTTFVEFRTHQHNPSNLGAAALQHIPNQLCDYMRLRGF